MEQKQTVEVSDEIVIATYHYGPFFGEGIVEIRLQLGSSIGSLRRPPASSKENCLRTWGPSNLKRECDLRLSLQK